MKKNILLGLIFLIPVLIHSQVEKDLSDMENKKKLIKLKIENLTDSIRVINLKIAKIESEKFFKKINDTTFTGIALEGAKLKKDSNVFSDIITVFEEDRKVIILDYKNGYFEICQNSLCGYINEVWFKKDDLISNYIQSKKIELKLNQQKNGSSSNYTSSLKRTKRSNSYKSATRKSYRTYIRGPRGGCYYINSKGNKTYVDRSLCN
ncbi:hypothetical protein [Wocania ichthyoenteri]|uniref:hypothetical protein n=1 Tax=Wocania ichthyoenteri TaxID=1230531 RepID=UPI00053E4EE6|nr:hypothetical protein [Wocania ichthyoenteri]